MSAREERIEMNARNQWALLITSLTVGCYSGLDRGPASLGPAPADGDGDDDGGSADDDDDDDHPPRAGDCGDNVDVGYAAMRRLSRSEYLHTVHDVLGVDVPQPERLPADTVDGLFKANTEVVDDFYVDSYTTVAEQTAAIAVPELALEYPCDEGVSGADCAAVTLDAIGRRIHRRPLDPVDRTGYLSLYARGETHEQGMQLMLAGMLQSPYFLYRIETSEGPGEVDRVDPWALASRLSYFVWDSAPDDELLDLAQDGSLHEEDVLRAQVQRMLADPRGQRGVVDFHRQWLELDHADQYDKDPRYEIESDLREAMEREIDDLLVQAIEAPAGWLRILLTSTQSHVDDPLLAEVYGLDADAMPWGEDVTLPSERSGILTRPAFLAVHSHPDQLSPVKLGYFIRTKMLCQTVPPPPENFDITLPEFDPTLPMRERYRQHSEDPACAGCHIVMDGIGFAYEGFDPTGRFDAYATGELGDVSGELFGTDVDGSFEGPAGLADLLVDSSTMRTCAAEAFVAYAVHRHGNEHDTCTNDAIAELTISEDPSVEELVVAVVTSDAFGFRRSNPDM